MAELEQLDEIIRYIKKKTCILFFGAGISKIAGCNDWASIVNKLINHEIITKSPVVIGPGIGGRANSEIIEYCYRLFNKNDAIDEYRAIIRTAYLKRHDLFNDQYLPLINKIKKIDPLPGTIVTTNIDDCLEEARVYDSPNIYYRNDHLNASSLVQGITHLHGYIESFDDSIWRRSQYVDWYKQPNICSLVEAMLVNYNVLFLGYGFGDNEILDIALNCQSDNLHFALMPTGKIENKHMYQELYNIKIIEYGQIEEFSAKFSNWIERNFSKGLEW